MKIIVLGDFHGQLSEKMIRKIKKIRPDLIISLGDYQPFKYRKIWFKYCYESREPLFKFIGTKKYKQLLIEDLDIGEKVLKRLNKIGIPIFTVLGNLDYHDPNDIMDYKEPKGSSLKWEDSKQAQFLTRLEKYKGIQRIDYAYAKLGGFVFIGARGHSVPGKVKSKGYKKHKKILEKLFNRFSREFGKDKIIFVTHNVPFKTKLDLIGSNAHELAQNKHAGSKMFKRIIKKYQPLLNFGGHIHESFGIDKIGKTICVNPGAIHEGRYAIVDITTNESGRVIRSRVKVRLKRQ